MQRLLIVLLAAFDAVIATATGVAVALAPLTLLWVFGIASPDWNALWPAAGSLWQFGHLVPLTITLPDLYLAQTGIETDAATFTLSLAPLAFATFTAVFAARSGGRAARSGAWVTGVSTASIVVAGLAALIALTSRTDIVAVELWQAVLLPTLVFAIPALAGAVVTAWHEGDGGAIDAVRERVDGWGAWADVPGLAFRGAAMVVAGLVALGGLAVAVAAVLRGGQVIALSGAGHLDALGATVVTLGQLAYLPTLVIWAASFLAGPGFALGTGTAVSPAGTQLGVVPGIPVLGLVPDATSSWLLLLALLPIAVAGVAGWAVRARMAADADATGRGGPDGAGVRVAVAAAIAVLAAAVAALLAVVASGSFGPGRLAEVGPAPGPLALAVGVETLVGAGIVLLTARRAPRAAASVSSWAATRPAEDLRPTGGLYDIGIPFVDRFPAESEAESEPRSEPGSENAESENRDAGTDDTAPIEPWPPASDAAPVEPSEPVAEEPARPREPVPPPVDPGTLGRGRPAPLPPLD